MSFQETMELHYGYCTLAASSTMEHLKGNFESFVTFHCLLLLSVEPASTSSGTIHRKYTVPPSNFEMM